MLEITNKQRIWFIQQYLLSLELKHNDHGKPFYFVNDCLGVVSMGFTVKEAIDNAIKNPTKYSQSTHTDWHYDLALNKRKEYKLK